LFIHCSSGYAKAPQYYVYTHIACLVLWHTPNTAAVEDPLSHFKPSFPGVPSPCSYKQFRLHHSQESLDLTTSSLSASVVPSENTSQNTSSCKESEFACIFSYSVNSPNKDM